MVLGSLRQVGKNPKQYRTAADAQVKRIVKKKGLVRYRYASRHTAAKSRFDKKIKSGKYKGKTVRQMFSMNRAKPFKKGQTRDNTKCVKDKGMLSRSSVLLQKAYRLRKNIPVKEFAMENKSHKNCKTKSKSKKSKSKKLKSKKSKSKKSKSKSKKSKTPKSKKSKTTKSKKSKKSKSKKSKSKKSKSKTFTSPVMKNKLWNHYKIIGKTGKKCSNGKPQFKVKCTIDGKVMNYCSRDGLSNMRKHMKTKSFISARKSKGRK